MSDQVDLSGHRILVLEDNLLIALDIRHYLRAAGAAVLGPYGSEIAARRGLDTASPTAAVLDINNGGGPSYEIADLLQTRGIPFIFFSGYQPEVVPAAFAGTPYVQKFAIVTRLVAELAALLNRAGASPALFSCAAHAAGGGKRPSLPDRKPAGSRGSRRASVRR